MAQLLGGAKDSGGVNGCPKPPNSKFVAEPDATEPPEFPGGSERASSWYFKMSALVLLQNVAIALCFGGAIGVLGGAGGAIGGIGAREAIGVIGDGGAIGMISAGGAIGVIGAGGSIGVIGEGGAIGVEAIGMIGAGEARGVDTGVLGSGKPRGMIRARGVIDDGDAFGAGE